MGKGKMNRPAPLVLIVEDHAATREMYAMHLAANGFRYVMAGDGATAIRAALGAQPDVIIMDLSLPQIDGWASDGSDKSVAKTILQARWVSSIGVMPPGEPAAPRDWPWGRPVPEGRSGGVLRARAYRRARSRT